MIKMGKKMMKLPFLSKTTEEPSYWPWPSCGNSKTLSFRAAGDISIATSSPAAAVDIPESSFSASESGSFSEEEDDGGGGESVEAVIRRSRTADRLFFEPEGTSSMVEEDKKGGFLMKERTVVMAMESMNPREDIKTSMAEMVEAHGLKRNWDWGFLEELLSWYLRINGKNNHGYIVRAFVDLLLDYHAFASFSSCSLSASSSSSSGGDDHDQSCSCRTIDSSPTCPFSFSSSNSCTSRCLSSLEAEDEIEKPV
ncbi:hypothetical protein U1Q18_008109 [Sarracenia purpurea var. burkii]